jgi:hypothetical protein
MKNKKVADWNPEGFETLVENLPTVLKFFLLQEKIRKVDAVQYYSQQCSCTKEITFNIVFVRS